MTVAYQGEPGAFSEEAARLLFGRAVRPAPLERFKDVFQFAAKHRSSYGIVPIENSVSGSIHQNTDLLLRHKLHIIGEVKLCVQLHLMALPGVSLKNIRSVYSHAQVLGQCEDFLRSRWRVNVVAYYDTAGAAKMIRERNRRNSADIESARAASAYGLKILRRNVESNHHNYTRFIALSGRRADPRVGKKTSLVFAARNVPGALCKALAVFALREINMLKIESRTLIGKPWEYLFDVDVEGLTADRRMQQALGHLDELTTFLRVLGSYLFGKTIKD
jgi:prephenate dehydratase